MALLIKRFGLWSVSRFDLCVCVCVCACASMRVSTCDQDLEEINEVLSFLVIVIMIIIINRDFTN